MTKAKPKRKRPARPRVDPTAAAIADHAAARKRWPGVTIAIDDVGGRYYFDKARADMACEFFHTYLRHFEGEHAGQPFLLLDWQRELIIRPLFGWMRKSDDTRRFRRLFLEIGKKNGKSGLCSGLALLLAFADGEPGAQVYCAAGAEEQARIVFRPSAEMARNSPDFIEDFGVQILTNAIEQGGSASFLRPLTSKAKTQHGLNVHGLVFDEFHAQKDRELWDTLYKGISARRQPVIAIITTAGDDRESICREEYEYACRVRDGALPDDAYLPVVFEVTPADDWTSEAAWYKANPSLGVTKKLDYMRTECAAAIAEPRKRNAFLRLELNLWTESRTLWITPETWATCRQKAEPKDHGELLCCAGIDLSAAADLTAIVVAFRRPAAGRPAEAIEVETKDGDDAPVRQRLVLDYEVDLVPYFFIPEGVLRERVSKDRVPYDVWARDGAIRVTDGNVVDYAEVHRVVLEEVKAKHKGLFQVGYDPWNASHLSTSLLERGVQMVEVRQGYASLSGPSKLFEQLIRSGRLHHDGNPVMTWCVANCEVKPDDNGNIRPVKPRGIATGTRRIDGVVATLMALSRLMVAPSRSSRRAHVSAIG